MGILDFTEIGNKQDDFELFALSFLPLIGLKIISGPDRGADEKRDLIAEEGIGRNKIRWLVSCKHFAHANGGVGRAVSKSDERDIRDRTDHHECNAFMSFCSTIQTNGLNKYAEGYVNKKLLKKYESMNKEKIEKILLETEEGQKIASRFFEKSYNEWLKRGKQSAIHFDLSSKIQMMFNSFVDMIVLYKSQISIYKDMIIYGVKIPIEKIEKVEEIIDNTYAALKLQNVDEITTDEIESNFDEVFELLEELESYIPEEIKKNAYDKYIKLKKNQHD